MRNPDEANIARGLCASGVVDRIANIRDWLVGINRSDIQQTVRSRLDLVTLSSATIMDHRKSGTKRPTVSCTSYCTRPVKMHIACRLLKRSSMSGSAIHRSRRIKPSLLAPKKIRLNSCATVS